MIRLGVFLFWIFAAQYANSIDWQSICNPMTYFRCHDGTCISVGRKCNGDNDCVGGEDESDANCATRGRSCHERNALVAFMNNYRCRGACKSYGCNAQKKRCVCDDECGRSCIYPAGECISDPPFVEHSVRHYAMRVINSSLKRLPRFITPVFRDMVRYECEHGMRLVGPLPRCTGKKYWSNEVPQCVDATCGGSPVVIGGSVRHYLRRSQPVGTAEWNDVAVYECDPGLRLLGDAPRCQEDGTWSDHTLKCIVSCPYDQAARADSGRLCGNECELTFDCGPGEECYCDGECGRSCVNTTYDCGPAPKIQNALLNYTGEGIERRARYQCAEGYYLARGRLSLKCTGSGSWAGDTPDCQPVFCGNPYASIAPTGGEVYSIEGFYYGAEAVFRCRSNRRMLGSERRVCQANGQWSGHLTVCDLRDEEERCPHPGIPINGRLLGDDFSVGSTVRFTCDDGYIMKGVDEQTCLYYKQWSGDGAPLCVDPSHPHTATDVVATLTRALANMPDQKSSLGRFISQGETDRPHEIYFVFDVSESVLKVSEDLENEIAFAKRLVRRMEGFEGVVNYAIMVFASKNVTAMDITQYIDSPPDTSVVLRKLDEIYEQAVFRQLQKHTRSGTATSLALDNLKAMMSFMDEQVDEGEEGKKHVFLFTDGRIHSLYKVGV